MFDSDFTFQEYSTSKQTWLCLHYIDLEILDTTYAVGHWSTVAVWGEIKGCSRERANSHKTDERRLKSEIQNRGSFFFCLWSAITEADRVSVISKRVQHLCPSWDYIIFPNCKWSLSIHQPMNQQCREGRVSSMLCHLRLRFVWVLGIPLK